MVWGKAGSTTKTSASQLLDVTVSSNENNMMLRHIISSGNTAVYYRFNSDTGSNYAYGWSENGGAKSNSASQSRILYDTGGDAGDKFDIGYICNLSSEEKLIIGFQINEDVSGAGNAPVRGKGVFKWANTSDSITSINNFNTDQSGNYDTDSNMSVIGSDVTTAAAVPAVGANVQVGSRFEETDTRKLYNLSDQPTFEDEFTSDTDYTFTSGNSISGGVLTAKPAGSLGFTKPLGFTLGNTFVARVHGWEVQSGYSWSSSMSYIFGFSNTATNTAYNGSGNAWGFKIFNRNSGGMINNIWTKLNGSLSGGGNSTVGEGGTDLVTGTKYYIEMKKTGDGSAELRIYSDSDFTTLHTSAWISDTAMSNPTGLDHFALQGQTIGGTHVVDIDKIEVYNNTTNISSFTEWVEIGA